MHKYDTASLEKQADLIANSINDNSPAHKDLFSWYCKAFIQDSDPHEVATFDTASLGKHIKNSLDFIQQRSFGKLRIRVYAEPEQKRTIIELVNDDMPFLVDSVSQFLADREIEILHFFHPVCRIKRDKDGNFVNFSDMEGKFDGLSESIMQIHISMVASAEVANELQEKLTEIMEDVRKSTGDWQVMMRRLDQIISDFTSTPVPVEQSHLTEVTGFLRWLGNNHFTFLGFREYRYDNNKVLKQVDDFGLGLFRDSEYYVLRQDDEYVDVVDELNHIGLNGNPVTILKSNRKTNVHRFAHMDQIFITIYEHGEAVGQYCFIGLFTSTAYSARLKNIPLLNQKANEIIQRSGFRHSGHDGKTLLHVLDTYPRDEFFQTELDELYEIVMGIVKLEMRPTTKLFCRYDRFGRFVSAMVYLPRERLNMDARRKIGEYLADAFNGRLSTFSLWFSESNHVRIKYIIAVPSSSFNERPDLTEMETEIKRITSNWRESVREAAYKTDLSVTAVSKYIDAFPASYYSSHSAEDAVRDIGFLEEVKSKGDIVSHIIPNPHKENEINFRLFSPTGAIPLSDCLPIFENLGLRVVSENPHNITTGHFSCFIHEFFAENTLSSELNIETVNGLLADAFSSIYHGRSENDNFNKLTLAASLPVRSVAVLRAFSLYLKQTGISYSQQLIAECLIKHTVVAVKLYEMFDLLHNPAHNLSPEERREKSADLKQDVLSELSKVTNLDEDIIIRRMMNAVRCVLRTNVFCEKDYFSFKFDCNRLRDLPLPKPFREIWVYSTRIEGVHLRFGKVARGGLRWSDRREDFRTEVLGLVKAQQVKNAVIVPVGAKGGFFAKQLPDMNVAGRDAWLTEGIESYKIFISALLDVTDNIISGEIVPPQNVIRHDEDDPYLVVAADKGTATFSDIANGLSLERNFWLGDAFASGGSVGYDHKKMGITAKGAWEAVKRHFREKGKDIQTQEFTVIGVGDMSGDVFGNGMLLSRKIRLLAAFDHRDIFIDPNPSDCEVSFNERERLFNLLRSSWQDYDKKLISKGGGIFSRALKSIELTDEIKLLTGLTEDSVTPQELIKALLKSRTDLLWFGGIGTYIKSSSERDAQVGDKANDAIRITGSEVKALVIGEGANLGVTQKGRVEFALAGGAINTDAVDNSAGVDCSDHEVNIKIALGQVLASGKLSQEERNELLASMTDEVSDLVLKTNYDQTLTLSVTQHGSVERLDLHVRFLAYLEKYADLNRDVENLPDELTIRAGRNGHKGLTRPELCVVMAYAKLYLYKKILESNLPDEEFLGNIVRNYMPTPLANYQDALDNHPLKREIITTVITNRAINEGGVSFAFRLCERLNVGADIAIRAYLVAREIMGLDELLAYLKSLDNKIPTSLQTHFYEILRRALFDQTRRILIENRNEFDMQSMAEKYKGSFQMLLEKTEKSLAVECTSERFAEFYAPMLHENIPQEIVKKICAFYFFKNGFDIIELAKISQKDIFSMSQLYLTIVGMLGLDELRRKATEIPLADIYDQKALSEIIAQMDHSVFDIVLLVAQSGKTAEEWFETHKEMAQKYFDVLYDAASVSTLGLSRLSIIASSLRLMI